MFVPPQPGPPIEVSESQAGPSLTSDTKRTLRSREHQFLQKYGHRHHTYDHKKAPYPLSYDKEVLELESLDNTFTRHLRGSASFVDFETPPTRVLDLGCGMGTWIIDAAKEWPECEFVGFDLVNVQIPLNPKLLDPSIISRITWKHGNFLTTKLPFDEDDFDFVHVRSITRGVPETKWDVLFEEINRVLEPGGVVEVIEEDAIFPVLPRWFTSALRSRTRASASEAKKDDLPGHDHALLEYLMNSVYESRFINTIPTALLPSYFTTYFRQVNISPVITFPMPILAPLPALPTQIVTSYVIEPNSDTLEKRFSTFSPSTSIATRPPSYSFSSTSSRSSAPSKRPRTASATFSSSFRSRASTSATTPSPPTPEEEQPCEETTPSEPQFKPFMIRGAANDDSVSPGSLFPVERLISLSERTLAMHLYRSFQTVLACQEVMYEELKFRIRSSPSELAALGWESDAELEGLETRQRFQKLVERFRSDMLIRIAMWTSLTGFGWPTPSREPLSKAEIIEEECIREAMLKAAHLVTAEEIQSPCRSVRVLTGYKL